MEQYRAPRKSRKTPDHLDDFDSPWKTFCTSSLTGCWTCPKPLITLFSMRFTKLEESTNMRYISSAERIGMQRGREEGVQQGIALTLYRQLRRRFGEPPAWVETKLQEGTVPQLEQWADQLLDADTLEAVFKA
jgi:hypothetical protein